MRYVVEFTLKSGTTGLIIFTAADEEAAKEYMLDMIALYGHSSVYNLTPVLAT